MDKKLAITVIGSILLIVGVFLGFIAYTSGRSLRVAPFDPIVVSSSSDSYSRQMKQVRVETVTSSPKEMCLVSADNKYFDSWQNACELYYDKKRTSNYMSCLANSTTTADKANYYKNYRILIHPELDQCGILLKENIFPSNCLLYDGSGKIATENWKLATQMCEEEK